MKRYIRSTKRFNRWELPNEMKSICNIISDTLSRLYPDLTFFVNCDKHEVKSNMPKILIRNEDWDNPVKTNEMKQIISNLISNLPEDISNHIVTTTCFSSDWYNRGSYGSAGCYMVLDASVLYK